MKLIENGDNMAADMGENIEWLAYANMDQAMRILTDGPVIKDGNENTPLRVFDDSNVKEAGAPEYVEGLRRLLHHGLQEALGSPVGHDGPGASGRPVA